jgi:membrane-associated phospholipid phosphatase
MRVRSVVGGGILVVLAAAASARAQSVGSMVVSDVRDAVGDVVDVWISPFRDNARDWLGAGAVIAGSAAFMPWDDDVDRWIVRHHDASAWSALHAVREGGSAFAGKDIVPAVAGAYVVGLVTKNQAVRDAVWGCLASYASESVVRTQVVYRLVARDRPDSVRGAHPLIGSSEGDQYRFGFPGDGWGKHSIPAGHVANVAGCASYLSHRFHLRYATPVLYVVVAGVGIGRMVDRRHWTSDTVLGTLIGYAIGKEVATRTLHRESRSGSAPGTRSSGVTQGLFVASGATGVELGWRVGF